MRGNSSGFGARSCRTAALSLFCLVILLALSASAVKAAPVPPVQIGSGSIGTAFVNTFATANDLSGEGFFLSGQIREIVNGGNFLEIGPNCCFYRVDFGPSVLPQGNFTINGVTYTSSHGLTISAAPIIYSADVCQFPNCGPFPRGMSVTAPFVFDAALVVWDGAPNESNIDDVVHLVGNGVGGFFFDGGFQNPNTWEAESATFVFVPEPSSLLLLSTGLVGLVCLGWRRTRP